MHIHMLGTFAGLCSEEASPTEVSGSCDARNPLQRKAPNSSKSHNQGVGFRV